MLLALSTTTFSVQNINAENSVGYAEISVGFAENIIAFAENSHSFVRTGFRQTSLAVT